MIRNPAQPPISPSVTIHVSGVLSKGHISYLDQLVASAVECGLWPLINVAKLQELDRVALAYLMGGEGLGKVKRADRYSMVIELVMLAAFVALLGSATPPLNIPLSVVADQLKRPLVTSFAPIRAWLSGRPSGWRYGWDTSPDEVHQCDVFYQAANLARTNHRVALFTDTEQDGIVMGGLCPQRAPKFGYKIAYHASFAVGTTNFSSQIAAAQAAHAQVLIAQITPPDAITLWKQIKALSYRPLIALCAKGADTGGWRRGIGKLAEGTMTGDFWSPSMGFPQSRRFVARYAKQLGGITPDLSAIVAAYSVARVLFDALVAARSKDPMAINTALARTHKTYPLGPIAFGPDHTHPLLWVIDQWQGANTVRVFPTGKGAARIEVPPPGLR